MRHEGGEKKILREVIGKSSLESRIKNKTGRIFGQLKGRTVCAPGPSSRKGGV